MLARTINAKPIALLLLMGLSWVASVRAADEGQSAQDPATKVHVLTADMLKIKAVPSTRSLQIDPKDFIEKVALRSNLLVVLGNLATRRAQNEDLRVFSQRLVDTHDGWFEHLNRLAAPRGVLLPNEMTPEEIKTTDHLTEMVDLDFDQDFLWHVLTTLRTLQAQYAAAANSTDAEVASFARERQGQLRSQHEEAIKVGQQLLKSGAAGSVKTRAYDDPNTNRGGADPRTTATHRSGAAENKNDQPLPQAE